MFAVRCPPHLWLSKLRWQDIVSACVITIFILKIYICSLQFSLETAAIRGVIFYPKLEFSSYVCEAY